MAGNFTPAGIEYLVKNFSKGMGNLGKLDKAQQNLGKSATDVSKQFTGLGKGVLSVGAKAGGAALAGVAALGAGVAALGVASVKTAISFESAFAGVLKTTDGLTDSMGNLNIAGTELREGFVDLSKEVPLAFEELAAIGELGGQLGIGRDALLEFTESVAALGVSTNLSTEEAASGLARMSNIFNISAEDMGGNITRLGSSIVDLGNNFATTERDILAMAERLAGAGAIAGFTQADILGIGAAMSSVGVQAEAGGTAVQKVLLAINNAVVSTTTGFVDNTEAIEENVNRLISLNGKLVALESKAGLTGDQILQMRDEFIAAGGSAEEFGRQLGATERRQLFETAIAVRDLKDETQLLRDLQGTPIDAGQLEKFASVAGLAAGEFEQLWKEDASQAFQLFVEGLGKQGDEAVNTLDELGLTDQRLIRAFLSLSGAGDLLERTLDTANGAFEDNTALADEAAKRYATTESQLLIFKNTIRAVGDAIGSRFLPFLNRLITAGKNLVNKFADPIADAIDEKVIPAIEGIIKLGSDLFATFQEGGAAGLAEALGLTPETTELIDKIVQAFTDLGIALGLIPEPKNIIMLAGVGDVALDQSPLVAGLSLLANNIIPALNAAIVFINQNFEAFKGAVIGVGAALASAAIVAILGTIGSIIAAIGAPIILIVGAAAALGAIWTSNWLGIRDTVVGVWEKLQPIFETIIEWFETNIPVAVQTLSDIWTNNLLPAFQEVGRAIQENILPLLNQLMEFLRSEGPGAVQVMSDIWDNVLLPSLRTIGNFILNTLLPIWTRMAVIFIEQIPASINRTIAIFNFLKANFNNISNFVTGTLIPAFSNLITWVRDILSEAVNTAINLWNLFLIPIQAVSDFFNANVIPVFQSVANFLDAVLSVALTAAAGLWENILLPALQAVWNFISANILPIFQSVKDTGETTVGITAETIADIWNNTLLPAFNAVWNFIQDNILPIFNTLAYIINIVVIAAIDALISSIGDFVDTTLENLKVGIEGIKTVLSEVTDFFNTMADTVRNFELPPILQPGSPTPFEMGLRGITSALGTPIQTAVKKFQEAVTSGFLMVQSQLDLIVSTITLMITKLLPELSLTTDNVTTEMEKAFDSINNVVQDIQKSLMLLSSTMATLATNLDSTSTSIGKLTQKLAKLTTQLGKVEGATEDAVDEFDNFDNARDKVHEVKDAIEILIGALLELITQAGVANTALQNISVPPDLQLGSPSPFERSLMGINTQLGGLVTMIGEVSSGFTTVNQGATTTTTSISNQTFNISFAGGNPELTEAQSALMIRQSVQRQLSTV